MNFHSSSIMKEQETAHGAQDKGGYTHVSGDGIIAKRE